MTQVPGRVTTSAGVTIGCAYQPPPASMGSEAERIQSALLARIPTRPTALQRMHRWLKGWHERIAMP